MLKIGCDPEFLFVKKNGDVRYAEYALDVGLYAEQHSFASCPLGCDGSGGPAEVRVPPATTPMKVVAGIATALSLAPYQVIRDYTWRAGACYQDEPIGGHIHFSTPRHVPLTLFRVLTDVFTEIRRAIEPRYEIEARLNAGYGRLSDESIRGDTRLFEWRPPLSWLVSPQTSFAYLSTAYACVRGALVKPSTIRQVTCVADLYDNRREFKLSREVVRGVRGMLTYLEKRNINWSQDMRTTWGLK